MDGSIDYKAFGGPDVMVEGNSELRAWLFHPTVKGPRLILLPFPTQPYCIRAGLVAVKSLLFNT